MKPPANIARKLSYAELRWLTALLDTNHAHERRLLNYKWQAARGLPITFGGRRYKPAPNKKPTP